MPSAIANPGEIAGLVFVFFKMFSRLLFLFIILFRFFCIEDDPKFKVGEGDFNFLAKTETRAKKNLFCTLWPPS